MSEFRMPLSIASQVEDSCYDKWTIFYNQPHFGKELGHKIDFPLLRIEDVLNNVIEAQIVEDEGDE